MRHTAAVATPDPEVALSRFLSFVLRHQPGSIGLELDAGGWVGVEALLEAAGRAGRVITRGQLERAVATNSKQRFALSADGARVRASQGHSVPVDLGLERREPPLVLFHGTAERFLASILEGGLVARGRQQVHLSVDRETAQAVGRRHGRPIVLAVEARLMHRAGHAFTVSDNGVWLTESVPDEYLVEPCGWRESPLADMVLLSPWSAVDSAETSEALTRELVLECGPGHALSGVRARAVADYGPSDDFLFALPAGRFAVVHLTFRRKREQPGWPSLEMYESLDDFVSRRMLPDHEDWE